MRQCDQLRKYNKWRRGDDRLKMPNPSELGELIDSVADRLEALERERVKFLEDIDSCYRMLLAEPNTIAALSNTEGILRQILAEAKLYRISNDH